MGRLLAWISGFVAGILEGASEVVPVSIIRDLDLPRPVQG